VAFCEFEDFPRKVLAKHWPDIPCYPDVRELTKEQLENDGITDIGLLCGGFPCQPFSSAARGRNPKDTLSHELIRLISEVKPRYAIIENTEKKAFSIEFIKQLRSLNYGITVSNIGAHEIGADHERSRWWVVAHPNGKSELQRNIDAEMARMSKVCKSLWNADSYASTIRVSNGVPREMDRNRLKALGNSVVPQIPELIGRAIMQADNE
jgi:DNA (cytosine-5)-methyltransferase 1